MASPTFVSVSSLVNEASAAINIPAPSGIASGDLIILVAQLGYSNNNLTPPSGFTLLDGVDLNSQFEGEIEVYWKIAGSSEPSTYSVAVNQSGSTSMVGCGFSAAYRGASATPIQVHASASNISTASTSIPNPSVTTTSGNTTVVCVYSDIAQQSSPTYTPATGMTNRIQGRSTQTGYAIALDDMAFATAGATGTLTATASANVKPAMVTFAIASNAAATAITMTGPTSGTVAVASTNFTIGANGTISGTVTVTPSDGGGGGTFTPSSVQITSGSPTATFTYTPASAGNFTISVTNNGSLTNPSNITYTASSAAATATTLSGPATCTVGTASANFTVGANGTITGTVVITPTDNGGGGTFTPSTVSISSASPTGTFTYTAASAGTKTIGTTNNASLTNPTNLSVTANSSSVTLTMNGALNVTNILTNGFTLSWSAGSATGTTITGYEYSTDGGTTWVDNTTALTVNVGSKVSGTAYQCKARCYDGSGNRSAAISATVTTNVTIAITQSLKNIQGQLWLSTAFRVTLLDMTADTVIVHQTNVSTDSVNGVLASFTAPGTSAVKGTQYRVLLVAPDGSQGVSRVTPT